jgi:glycosyltransferase involved in cell wall biosynthesis
MHIVQIAPPWYPLPPEGYGGIERVVFDLAEGLIAAGHQVTVIAPTGSRTSGRLIESLPAVGLDMSDEEKTDHFLANGRYAYKTAAELGADLVHDHTDYSPDPGYPLPIVRTIHGPAVPYHVAMYEAMSRRGDWFVAISERQRQLFDEAAVEQFGAGEHIRFAGVVPNPIDVASTPWYPREAKEDYVAFLGRCHREKAPDAAIRVAVAAGVRLKMALRVTTQERPYFDAVVGPALKAGGDQIDFLGEVGGSEKMDLIGRARAVIFPSPWEEPFGLVLTEAAAHGTPVVALRRGASPEIVVDGVTGFLCNDEAEMAAALPQAMALDPASCRAHVAATFDRPVIADRQAAIYERVLTGRSSRSLARSNAAIGTPAN